MRSTDIVLRVLVITTFVTLLARPDSKIADILLCLSFFAVGLWGVMFPSGVIGWAKTAHKELDPSDKSVWWISRIVGAGLILIAMVLALTMMKSP
jgi:TRAP-type C4-dicarboxylate transport system permease small subunit